MDIRFRKNVEKCLTVNGNTKEVVHGIRKPPGEISNMYYEADKIIRRVQKVQIYVPA